MIVVYNLRENYSNTMGNFHSIQVFRDGVKEFSSMGSMTQISINSNPQLSISTKAQLLALHLDRL